VCKLLVLCVLASAPIVDEPGVIIPDAGFRERAAVVESNTVSELTPPDAKFSGFLTSQLPASDRSQFSMVAYVDRSDPESRRLLADLEQHPSLRILKNWCKFTVIEKGQSIAAEARHAAAKLAGSDIPALMVFADPRHPVFGEIEGKPGNWRYAFQRAGYGGDAGLLARNIYDALVKHYQTYGVEQCPGPYCPYPNPNPDQPVWPPDNRPVLPDWNTPDLPNLDEQPPSPVQVPDVLVDVITTVVSNVVWIVLLIVIVLLMARKSKGAASIILILALCSPMMADNAIDADNKAESSVEQQLDPLAEAYYPDRTPTNGVVFPPQDLAWVVRSEVRQALHPDVVGGLLADSLIHTESRVFSLWNNISDDIAQKVGWLVWFMILMIVLQGVTLGAVLWIAAKA